MENRSTVTTTLLENNESNTTVPSEPEQYDFRQTDDNSSQPSSRNKGIPWYWLIIGALLIMLVMNVIEVHQYKQYSAAVEQEAYVLSVSINLLEDTLLFNYRVLPQDIGFEELRSAWISNPCYETAMPYYEALKSALDYLDNTSEPTETLEPIMV